jgi:quinol monooxygenase YgiN
LSNKALHQEVCRYADGPSVIAGVRRRKEHHLRAEKGACMNQIQGNPGEIRELARYEIRPDAIEEVLAAIHEFVAYIRASEPGAVRYEVWQEVEAPTRFVHQFVWRDEEANRIHGQSEAVRKFAGTLYPKCLAPVEFVTYRQVDANASFARV